MAVRERSRMLEPDIYHVAIYKLVPTWEECINVLRNYAERKSYSFEK